MMNYVCFESIKVFLTSRAYWYIKTPHGTQHSV